MNKIDLDEYGTKDKWEFYQDKRKEWRFRRSAMNGNIVGASCESFTDRISCVRAAERNGMDGNVNNYGASDSWSIYEDKRGEYRWRRRATNGNIVGSSVEGYIKKSDCERNAIRHGCRLLGLTKKHCLKVDKFLVKYSQGY